MRPEATIDRQKLASEYLITVQSLSEELARATAAIARNDVDALEKHIETQQRLCAQLLSLVSHHPVREGLAGWHPVPGVLRTLVRNNQVYSTLLETSGRSHRVLLTLCKSYKDSSNHAADRDARKLSCEV
jgi:hypothetical protein